MSNIATSIVQSRHLLELGLDPASADMFWMDTNSVKPCLNLIDDGIFNHRNYLVRFPNTSLPAWSLSALLEVMPKENEPDLQKSPATGQYFMYGFFDLENPTYMTKDYDSPIDAAYEMVCWLLQNGYIKKGGQDDD